VGGEHLHHYMWGIGLVSAVGGVAVHGEDAQRRHPVVALSYGAGLALIVDEFALLLDLKDVYWAKQGRISIDLGVGAARWPEPISPPCRCSGAAQARTAVLSPTWPRRWGDCGRKGGESGPRGRSRSDERTD
jgi:hypothetical protein